MNAGAPSSTAQSARDHKDISNILKQQAKICTSLFQSLDERDVLDRKIATLLDKLLALDERGRPIWNRIKQGDGFSPRTRSLNPEALEELRRHRNAPHYLTLAKKNSIIFEAKEVADKEARESETAAPLLPLKQSLSSPVTHNYEQSQSSQASPSTVVPRTSVEGYEGDHRRPPRLRRDSRAIGLYQPVNDANDIVEKSYSPNSPSFRRIHDPPSTSKASTSINARSTSVGRAEEASSAYISFPSTEYSPKVFSYHPPRNSGSKAVTPINPINKAIRRRTQSFRSGITQLSSIFSPSGSSSKPSASQPEEDPNEATSPPRQTKSTKRV